MANKFKTCAAHSWRSLGIFEKTMNEQNSAFNKDFYSGVGVKVI